MSSEETNKPYSYPIHPKLFFTLSSSSRRQQLASFFYLSLPPIQCTVLLVCFKKILPLSGTEVPTPLPNRQDGEQTREHHMACHTHITLSLSTLSVNIFNLEVMKMNSFF